MALGLCLKNDSQLCSSVMLKLEILEIFTLAQTREITSRQVVFASQIFSKIVNFSFVSKGEIDTKNRIFLENQNSSRNFTQYKYMSYRNRVKYSLL